MRDFLNLIIFYFLIWVMISNASVCENISSECILKICTLFCMYVLSRSVVSDSLQLHGLYSPWNSPGQNTDVGSLSLLQGIFPTQGSKRSPTLQADSLPAKPQGKPKNTGMGSLSLLQGIFPTQESNQGLLHCRWILYQLSYQGSPHMLPRYCSKSFKPGFKSM